MALFRKFPTPRPEPDLLNRSFLPKRYLGRSTQTSAARSPRACHQSAAAAALYETKPKLDRRGARKSRNGFAYRDKNANRNGSRRREIQSLAKAKPTLGPYRRCEADSGRSERRDEAAKRSYSAWRLSSFLLARSRGRQKGSQIAQLRRHPGSPWDRNIAQRWQSA
jgi:hypothetical protein